MKSLSIRDIIGPVMIGPSSSHTAGALRIARMCRRLLSAEPVRAVFTLYGSFAHTYQGHGTDRALVAGMLGMEPDDERIRDSFALAEEAGLSFAFIPCDDDSDIGHPNTVDIEVVDASGGVTSMRGESIGGGAAVISRLNGIDVSLTGEYHSIVVKQYDRRGVLAHIATCLNVFDVNIATTRLFRKKKGDIAYTIMQTDDKIPAELAAAVARHADILDVRVVESDRASETGAPVAAECAEAQGFGAGMSVAEAEEMLESLDFANGAELLAYCEAEDLPISDAICRRERCLLAAQGIAVDDTKHYLHRVLDVMRTSATRPLDAPQPSMGGLIGGEAQKLAAIEKTGLANPLLARATTYAMAVLETNASMGCIVAAPTAGSSGVLPAMLLACQDVHGFDDDRLERALANAAAIGYLITRNATVSGAEGGCQAEVG
ncbi:L-serine ammonia-lyase, iron-sulfur-dependent subunit beta, partial [Slackia equolifaciens]